MISKRLILLRVELIPSHKEETKLPSPQGVLNYKCGLYLKQQLRPPQRKIIVLTTPRIIDLPSTLDGGQLSLSLEIIDNLCHFCSYNVVENEAHFVFECPLCNFIRDRFHSLIEKVVLRSFKSFIQLDLEMSL